MAEDLIYRLRKRAEIRRQIPGRKSVMEGKPDRIADLFDEAADRLTEVIKMVQSSRVKNPLSQSLKEIERFLKEGDL